MIQSRKAAVGESVFTARKKIGMARRKATAGTAG
jgi:hypothetical protein